MNQLYFEGIGIHTGKRTKLTLFPSSSSKISFALNDGIVIDATIYNAYPRWGANILKSKNYLVFTVEHLLSVIYAKGIGSIIIGLDENEVPIGDGSGSHWVDLIERFELLYNPSKVKKNMIITKQLIFKKGESWLKVEPQETTEINVIVEFDDYPFLNGEFSWDGSWDSFKEDIAPARSFIVIDEIDKLLLTGMGKGGWYVPTLVFDKTGRLLRGEELRSRDEPVRHKLLDLIGDISLLGLKLKGRVTVFKPSHVINIELLKQLIVAKDGYIIE